MPDRHKRPPVSIRFPDEDRIWLAEQSKRTGEAVQRIIIRAVRELRGRDDPGQPGRLGP